MTAANCPEGHPIRRPNTNAHLAERLWTIGRLADGVAMDLRQSLSVIRNSVYFLNTYLGEHLDDKVRRHLGLMWREIDYANRVLSRLAWFTGQQSPDRQLVDVELLVHSSLNQLTIPATIKVETAVPCSAALHCDPVQLSAALANVIENSIQAMPNGGHVRIAFTESPKETRLTISDTGPGMENAVRVQVFDPLFSTSPHRSGLGLTIARMLVSANGGWLDLADDSGPGTTLVMRFPRFEGTTRED